MSFLALFCSLISLTWASQKGEELAQILHTCFPADKLRQELLADQKMKRRNQIPDFKLAISSGYSNNEISQANPERMQVGIGLRWSDITDNQKKHELIDNQIESKKNESKLLIEEYWQIHLLDFYYWKWGKPLKHMVKGFLNFSEKKILLAEDSFKEVATSRLYSDLMELNQQSLSFLAKLEVLDQDFGKCKELAKWEEKLDYDKRGLEKNSQGESPRIHFQKSYCENQKKTKTIMLERESGKWGLSFGSSINQNRQLGSSANNFNDIRVGLELSIPLNLSSPYKVTVDRCDYDIKLKEQTDTAERASAKLMYPILVSLEKQFKLIKENASLIDLKSKNIGMVNQDVVQIGLNILRIHKLLSEGESNMNSRFIPSKIAEHDI